MWNWVHIVVGGAAVALSTIVAANTKSDFLGSKAVGVASAAAIASFLLTTLNPQKTAKGFVNAYRHLEKAISRFQFDPAVTEVDLGKADAEGIDLLDERHRPQRSIKHVSKRVSFETKNAGRKQGLQV